MLPTNVMSFMKKMVATNEGAAGAGPDMESGTVLSKVRQTLSTGLMNAQHQVTRMTPTTRQPEASTPPDSATPTKPEEPAIPKPVKTEQTNRQGACRVCLKSFKEGDYSRNCYECHQKVCEDCASYYKQDENQDENTWRCSICRRKIQSRTQPVIAQDSTDSLLDVPVLEALQRRHSDVKIGSGSLGVTGGGPSGLAPPRSPELRRHSDVSPASLKELEKVKEKARERELEWRHKRGSGGGSPGNSRATSPSVERRPFAGEEHQQRSHRGPDEQDGDDGSDPRWLGRGAPARATSRRKSRVTKQHSYDDDVKPGGPAATTAASGDPGLGLPAALPRRASAYDVFMARGDGPGVNPASLVQNAGPGVGRRSSFRVPAPEPDDQPSASPLSPEGGPSLAVDEERRARRRGSQLPDIAAITRGAGVRASVRAPQTSAPPVTAARVAPVVAPEEHAPEVRRQASVQDGEAIKIVIHDVDYEPAIPSRPGTKRRVTLRRDPGDKAHRTRGFGMRVVGGKTGPDGRLFAYIVWTVPGGPAEKGGLQQGDKVLEWGGVGLTDRSFEDVCQIMDRTGDAVDLLVEHCMDLRMCDLLDEPIPVSARKNSGEGLGLQLDSEVDKSPASPTRRKLPKTPEQLAREKSEKAEPKPPVAVSGRIQLQVFYNDEKNEIVVSVFAADDLAAREDAGYGTLPEAYVQLRLLPFTGEQPAVKTDVAEPSQNPLWNTTVEIKNVSGEQLMDKTIEVSLWDARPDKEQVFLGESAVDLTKSLMEDCPVWYRLEDPRQIRSGKPSPRSSLVSAINERLLARGNRSVSEERESDDGDGVGSFLHPDHAYLGGSRRGSSQSEQLEVEQYQLNKDFSRSLPGSRRSSFQKEGEKQEAEQPLPVYNRERRRSSVTPRRDPDEILRSLKAVKGELLGRSMSISVDKRGQRRASAGKDGRGRKGSMMVGMERTEPLVSCSSPSDEEDRWSTKSEAKPLGPGQIQPRGHKKSAGNQAELKLSLLMTKGQLEVEVVCARGIKEDPPPDTYVKTYLRDGERWLQKRKTRVVRHSCEPQFRQTLRYSACDVLGRSLVVMLWEKQKGFEHNVGLGGAEIAFNRIKLTQVTLGWYPLFPIQTLGSDSNDSP
ncbi:regulating synaptic membrane exocytosis protein 1-like isoform X1 [Macrosteles quadrilineatus]|uniref:regulating synaptic membrane exocytosis protein 1-like isoform X1 n=1 Tax=Macrosteles quadrilineatus TaxID=74068 RepID=UPI0023E2B522|nr:regulating synaptic membrane exocytosis protein 1-like isoform X1 [Macrosteles quadrilineatus]